MAQSAMASAAVIFNQACGQAAVSAGNPQKPTSIGLQLYSVRDEVVKGLEVLLEKIAAMGYTHIETYGYFGRRYFGKTIADFKNMLDKAGLASPSAHVYDPPLMQQAGTDSWKAACEDAATLGQKYIVIPWMEEKLRPKDENGNKRLADVMTEAANIAQSFGLKFAYHNHDFEFHKKGDEPSFYDILTSHTDKDLVLLEMDIYWVHYAGLDPIALIQQHPGRIPLWHVKDMDPQTRANADIGTGEINFKEIFKHRETSGLDYFFVEQENYAVSPLDSIEKGIAYVKQELV